MLQEGDASAYEGAFKKKEIQPSRHKKDVVEEKEPGQVSATKSGWGTESNPAPRKIEEPSAVNDYNWDDDDEAEAEANANKKEETKEIEDELISQVAEAPKVLPTMQSIKELDRAVKFTIPSVTDGIDLTMLSSVLHPYDQLIERDEPWEFEKLFVKISSELQMELERKEKENDDKEGKEDDRGPVGM